MPVRLRRVGSKTNQSKVKEIAKELVIKELRMKSAISVPLRADNKSPVSNITNGGKAEDGKPKRKSHVEMQEGVCVK
jgi:hypothetical protein